MRKTSTKCCLTSRVLTLAATKNLNNGFLIHYHVHFPYEDILWCSTQSLAAKHHNLTGSLAHLPKYHLVDLLRGNPSAGEQLLYHPRSKLEYDPSYSVVDLYTCENNVTGPTPFSDCVIHEVIDQSKYLMCLKRGKGPIEASYGGPEGPDYRHLLHHRLPQAAWPSASQVNQVTGGLKPGGKTGLEPGSGNCTSPLLPAMSHDVLADGTQLSGGRRE